MSYSSSWNFNHLTSTPTVEYRKKQREKAEKMFNSFKEKWEGRQDYLTDVHILRQALDEYEEIENWIRWSGSWDDFWVIWSESYYYWLQTCLHSEDQEIRAKANLADEFATKLQNKILFFELSLARITEDKQSEFLSHSLLEPYHHFLEKQFASSKHLLSSEWEKILNLFSKTSYENWESMTSKFLSQSEREIEFSSWKKMVTLEELCTLSCDKDENIRKQAIKWINEIHFDAKELAENEINSILEYKKTVDDLRHFSSADEFVSLRDDISLDTINAMVDSVKDSYDFSREFYKFKASLFGVENFSYSEKTLIYWSVDKECPFDLAVDMVRKTLWNLDEEFLDIFNQSLEEWRIDVYPWKWKRWWAFCSDGSKWLPVYIMLNYTNKLRDASTLIHESWHHACGVMCKKQNALNYGCILSTAETHSTFFESLLADSLESELQWEELLAYRVANLDDMVATVSRQVAEYRFEQDLHKLFREKWYLSTDEIGKLFIKHMRDYTWEWIRYDEFDENRWISWHHSRMFFYVYSYASGYLAAQAMLKKLKNWELNIDQIKFFYSVWTSMSPEKIFATLWIDITKKEFRDEAMQELKFYLYDTIKLAKELNKIK